MTRSRIGVFVMALLWLSPAFLRAQAPTPNEALMKRADSITVGDYCDAAQAVLAAPAVIRALADDSTNARSNAAIICDPLFSSFSLLALTGQTGAPMKAIARIHTEGYSEARKQILEAMSQFRASVRADAVRDVPRASIPTDVNTKLVRASETAQSLLVAAARDRALTRLARYERKLGPTSAKLNGPEVLLNYAAQRWIPGFKATPLGGPSPLEIVATYAPGYVTHAGNRFEPVSASEFGLRYYLFGEQFGKTGFQGILMPSYWSVGALTASDRNGALVWPWDGRTRTGAFIGWGAIKVGYISGRPGEWLVTKQFQAVPFVF